MLTAPLKSNMTVLTWNLILYTWKYQESLPKAQVLRIKDQEAQRTFPGSRVHFWGNYLFQAGKTIDEDKALDTQLHDTKTACMYANTFILNRTCCMLQHALQHPEGGLTRLSWAAYNYAAAPTFTNNNRPQHQELGFLLSGRFEWVP